MKKNIFLKELYRFSAVFVCLTFLVGCTAKSFVNNRIDARYTEINTSLPSNGSVDDFLKPYRQHIDEDLSKVLSYNPQNLDRTEEKWQNAMTNFYADAIFETGNPVFEQRTGKQIDFCLLNYGGIRSSIAKGPLTTRTAFDIMPFENSAVVLGLKGETVYEMAAYILENKTAHPLSGIEIWADKNTLAVKDIKIRNKSIDRQHTYYVITNDYLAKGGDKMNFLLKSTSSDVLDYKLRNMFIAYFTKTDTLVPSRKPRIIFE